MSFDNSLSFKEKEADRPTILPPAVRRKIFLYLALLTLPLALSDPNGGVIGIPISFFLKNKLNLNAHELAYFHLLSAIPLYMSFVFGFIRDSWSPFEIRDRGYFMIFGAIGGALYAFFAFIPVSYLSLLVAVTLLTTASLFIGSSLNGLASTIGQQHAMSGQISAVLNTFGSLPIAASLLIGGV